MPVALGPFFVPFTKLRPRLNIHLHSHLPPAPRLPVLHQVHTISRHSGPLIQPPYTIVLRPKDTTTLLFNLHQIYCAILRSPSARCGVRVNCFWHVKSSSSRLRGPFSIQTRNFKIFPPSSTSAKPYSPSQFSRLGKGRIVIVLVVIAGILILQPYLPGSLRYPAGTLSSQYRYLELEGETILSHKNLQPNMIEEALPGRLGNLTPGQEENLREIWVATLQVFGVIDAHRAKETNGTAHINPLSDSQPVSEATASEKPKKKKLTLFGRKRKDSDKDSITSADSSSPRFSPLSPGLVADSDDKYGETKQFHETLAQQTPESLRATFWSMVKHDHPDALLLRFLRARKWDVERALVMMVSTMHWRSREMHVDDDIIKSGEEAAVLASQSSNPTTRRSGEDFLAQMRMGKSFLHGTDKSGRPMCFVRVRLHKQGEQTEESVERYTVFVIESARMLLVPPVDTACIVFDMTGFSLANMDYGPVKFMIKCFEANYPESLGVVLVHKAPWIFQGIWKVIKGWLDPVVASKVHFTNSVDEMEEFVPRSQIPRDSGGEENWSYHYIEPVANENDIMKDTDTRDKLLAARENIVAEYEKTTLDWISHETATGATEIKATRNKIAATLREDYWKLDPYIRARSLYDRTGMIQPGGKISFNPVTQSTVAASTANAVHEVKTPMM